jgi:molecular chaperone DnaJ
MRDFYEILGVDRNATDDEIKRAYRQLARQYHPDANPGDDAAAERFKEISVAYDTLSDAEKRRRYDMFGPEGVNAGAGGAGDPFGFGLNDLFDAFFGGGDAFGRGRGPSGPPRGPDAETVMTLTLAEVVTGITKGVDLDMPVGCEQCNGSGCAPGTHSERCPNCSGSGEVRTVRRSMLGQIVTSGPCPECSATGQIIPSPCPQCRGDGRIRGSRHLEVEVPAGIDDGQRLRLSGRGPSAPRGGVSGDLYVTVRVQDDPRFVRDGTDLHTVRRVAMTQAALGSTFNIETFDGEREITLNAGTQPGKIITLPSLGVPSLRNNKRGDLHVHVEVEIPDKLSNEQAELLTQFATMRGEDVHPHHEGFFSRIKSAFQ